MNFCATPKTYTDQPQYFDPLGPSGFDYKGRPIYAPTGGAKQRTAIFANQNATRPILQQNALDYIGRAQNAANNEGWKAAEDYTKSVLAGEYLNGSPALDNAMAAMRSGAAATAANQNAKIRSQFGRAGMNFSTANQQAQEANTAALAAETARAEAASRLANYQTERGYQQGAPAQLQTVLAAPLQYLAGIPDVATEASAREAGIAKELTGGGTTATPSSAVVNQPGVFDYGIQLLQAIRGSGGGGGGF